MKKITHLNQQLFVTLTIMIVGSAIVFGLILPTSMRYYFDSKIFSIVRQEQSNIALGETIQFIGQEGVYHLWLSDLEDTTSQPMEEELLHQRLMYKEYFKEIKQKAAAQTKTFAEYKYMQGNEAIYYTIDQSFREDTLVSYKIYSKYSMVSNQLFINLLLMIGITIGIILIIFFRWNHRLITNLKEIQLRLDEIGEGQLSKPIPSSKDTYEFQEVMCSLESMRQKLYENDRVKQEMIHNISHDLKTPLSVIKNYAEGIIDAVYPYGTVEETAHVIYNQADRLQKKVQNLLYLNRLEYMKNWKESKETFLMKDLIEEVILYMQDKEERIGIYTECDTSVFYGEREKWQVVIENLLDNAQRYAKEKIVLKVRNGALTLYNDGPSIDEVKGTSIFQPFEAGKGGVTGLGLSIVKKTIELYHYQITYTNEAVGVTFLITRA